MKEGFLQYEYVASTRTDLVVSCRGLISAEQKRTQLTFSLFFGELVTRKAGRLISIACPCLDKTLSNYTFLENFAHGLAITVDSRTSESAAVKTPLLAGFFPKGRTSLPVFRRRLLKPVFLRL